MDNQIKTHRGLRHEVQILRHKLPAERLAPCQFVLSQDHGQHVTYELGPVFRLPAWPRHVAVDFGARVWKPADAINTAAMADLV
jgi:hypothetical protein